MKQLNRVDLFIESIIIIGILFMCYIVIKTYPLLPNVIPTHWNFKDLPDEYGSKYNYFLTPILTLLLYVLFTFAIAYTIKSDYEKYSSKDFFTLIRMLRILKLMVVVVLLFLTYKQSIVYLKYTPYLLNVNTFVILIPLVVMVGLVMYKGMKTKYSK